jgi:hypothetical protein
MNHCLFFGKIVSRKISTENDTNKIELRISVQKQRKAKSGLSVSENATLTFEAWDSAASTIEHNTTVGDFLIIPNSTAKIDGDKVYFRINEFKIVKAESLSDN